MKTCARQQEVTQAVQAGQWPLGVAEEVREHVAACAACADEVRLAVAFQSARAAAMRVATPQSAGLLWWKAQIRRRQEAMEKLERPGFAISTAAMAVSLVLLGAVLLTVWKQVHWSRTMVFFSPHGWSVWMVAGVAAVLFGFVVAAVAVGLGLSEERG